MRPLFTDSELASGLTPKELISHIDPLDLLEDDPAELSADELAEEVADILADIREQEPVLVDLLAVGYRVKSLWFLSEDPKARGEAVPILIQHLRSDCSSDLKMLIAKQLHFVTSSGAWQPLLEEFRQSDKDTPLAETIAFALANAAGIDQESEMIELVKDVTLGPVRIAFLRSLWRLGTERARATVERSAEDPELSREAKALLRSRGPKEA